VDSANLYAERNDEGETVTIGGTALDNRLWSQTLTRRAARSLWFDLTRLLFPEKSDQVIAQVTTMPSMPRFNEEPTRLTSWTFVTQQPDGGCVISGWNGFPGWCIRLSAYEVYRFWATLDIALFPTGW
jgi:hypothetical protein